MPRFRAGAFDKGSRQRGQYVVVDADSRAAAMLDARRWFPGVPIQRMFANDAEPFDKIDNNKHAFSLKQTKGSQ